MQPVSQVLNTSPMILILRLKVSILLPNIDVEMMGGETKFSLAANWTDTTVDSYNPDNINAAKVEMLEDNLPQLSW